MKCFEQFVCVCVCFFFFIINSLTWREREGDCAGVFENAYLLLVYLFKCEIKNELS